mgnify:FL=1
MAPLAPGVYEALLTRRLEERLQDLDATLTAHRRTLDPDEAADRIALYVARLVEREVEHLGTAVRADEGAHLANAVLEVLAQRTTSVADASDQLSGPPSVLHAIAGFQPDGSAVNVRAPHLPLLDTALLTNAPGEPRLGHHLLRECESADRIDVVMAFIRRTGITPMLEALRHHVERGGRIRVLTTTYTGSTERAALDRLADLGAEIRVSYDVSTTRLHAKAWIFHRDSGFTTAYLGSSNLTHSAQVDGLEWNVRISSARNAPVIDKMSTVFESYWDADDFEAYDPAAFDTRMAAQRPADAHEMPVPVRLHALPFQDDLLERIRLARERGRHRNLLVAATGTGKTVMAALDYAHLRRVLPRARLLFVAHRKEILEQARATYRIALGDAAFGELWVGGTRPERFEHVFASIQSLRHTDLAHVPPDHFDVVVVDEFHHAAASTYVRLLEHVQPRELLGLTGTPERTDGVSVLDWFDGEIAAELRLWDAIDQHRLTPFAYYGVHDGTDLRNVPWRRGQGYDAVALEGLYTGNDAWADLVLKNLADLGPSARTVRALGFCVGVQHARFMADHFQRRGVAAVAVTGATPPPERDQALRDLRAGDIQVVFAVDVFNEGVDVPSVNTLLMLRPTDSPLLFQQQLGRGLRKTEGKAICTVLDFIGQHAPEYRMERRLGTLLRGGRRELQDHIQDDFPHLPAGCHMTLDPIAQEIVLDNLRRAIPSKRPARVEALCEIHEASGRDVDLATFLDHTGLALEDVYANKSGWSDLREEAGLPVAASGPHEQGLRHALGRMLHIDDEERIQGYRTALMTLLRPGGANIDLDRRPTREQRIWRMLLATLFDQITPTTTYLETSLRDLAQHPQVMHELLELLDLLDARRERRTFPLADRPNVPLRVHGHYTRIEMLAAFGHGDPRRTKVVPWQTGVLWHEAEKADLLTITMNKNDRAFSPTTRYRDYAISRTHMHWESQSVTRAQSDTGLRYQHHAEWGSSIFLFARHERSERAYSFLGPATYVRHEGERPMAITWALTTPLPGDLFTSFAAAVA